MKLKFLLVCALAALSATTTSCMDTQKGDSSHSSYSPGDTKFYAAFREDDGVSTTAVLDGGEYESSYTDSELEAVLAIHKEGEKRKKSRAKESNSTYSDSGSDSRSDSSEYSYSGASSSQQPRRSHLQKLHDKIYRAQSSRRRSRGLRLPDLNTVPLPTNALPIRLAPTAQQVQQQILQTQRAQQIRERQRKQNLKLRRQINRALERSKNGDPEEEGRPHKKSKGL